MDKRTKIIAGAERVFEAQGFRGTGVDGILAPSQASTRTLYKHFGSREGLVLAVLKERHRSFMAHLASPEESGQPVETLFDVLEQWSTDRGAWGCMLLRAHGEYAEANQAIVDLVRRQKDEFRLAIAGRVAAALGCPDPGLAMQVWLLFEGATAAAPVSGREVFGVARQAAAALIAMAARGPA
jgi:AcrR family transcriptional regulator